MDDRSYTNLTSGTHRPALVELGCGSILLLFRLALGLFDGGGRFLNLVGKVSRARFGQRKR